MLELLVEVVQEVALTNIWHHQVLLVVREVTFSLSL